MRDSMGYLPRYLGQIEAARPHLKSVEIAICEGNSTDGTKDTLKTLPGVTVATFDTGTPYFPSNENETRWQVLTASWNKALDIVPECDVVVCVESELIWTPDVLVECIRNLDMYDVVAPMLFMQRIPHRFYDTNGFRRYDQKFSNEEPIIPGWDGERFVECETVGGLIVFPYRLVHEAEWRGTCRLRFPEGTKIVADTAHRIYHP